jgi:hypothetical protein
MCLTGFPQQMEGAVPLSLLTRHQHVTPVSSVVLLSVKAVQVKHNRASEDNNIL